jgi:hypothetical protein
MQVTAAGFSPFTQDVTIRNAVPVMITAKLALAGAQSSITVEAAGADMLEVDPSAHTDADRTLLMKMPIVDPSAGLSQAITYATGGVAADANGLFHPVGDHAQSSFMVDGQPISDQQSKVFSTQLPTSAIQSMEIVTGTPDAEFGDKSSLIANITTRSGLGAGRVFGNLDATYGSFGTTGGSPVWASAMRTAVTSWCSTAHAAGASSILRSSLPFTTRATHKRYSTASITSRTGPTCFT